MTLVFAMTTSTGVNPAAVAGSNGDILVQAAEEKQEPPLAENILQPTAQPEEAAQPTAEPEEAAQPTAEPAGEQEPVLTVAGGEAQNWSQDEPADLSFVVQMETGEDTVRPETMQLSLRLPEPFSFIEGEAVWQGNELTLGGRMAIRLEGLDGTAVQSNVSAGRQNIDLALQLPEEGELPRELRIIVAGTALQVERPARAARSALAAPSQGDVLLTVTLSGQGVSLTRQGVQPLAAVSSVTATGYRNAFETNIYWVDANNEDKVRPEPGTYPAPAVSYRITPKDGTPSGNFTPLTPDRLDELGMSAMPSAEYTVLPVGGWYCTIGGKVRLPSEIKITDIYGDDTYYTVEWAFEPQEQSGYDLVELTEDNQD